MLKMNKKTYVKKHNEQHWFKLWITQHYSIRQLASLSGHSISKLKRIKNDWLRKNPPEFGDLSSFQYLVLDGTYFHKDGCLMTLMNAPNQMILSGLYAAKEGFDNVFQWLGHLREQGLRPLVFTTDGERSVLRAILSVWPQVRLQRCLYHLQHEGCRWLRTYPKTEAGKALRQLLLTLTRICSIKERNHFISAYKRWKNQYQSFVLSLSVGIKVNFDLKRTITLLLRICFIT